jgi:hypothetical protein
VIAAPGGHVDAAGWYHSTVAPLLLKSPWPGQTDTADAPTRDRFRCGERYVDVIALRNAHHVTTDELIMTALLTIKGAQISKALTVLHTRTALLTFTLEGLPGATIVVATDRHIIFGLLKGEKGTMAHDERVFIAIMQSIRELDAALQGGAGVRTTGSPSSSRSTYAQERSKSLDEGVHADAKNWIVTHKSRAAPARRVPARNQPHHKGACYGLLFRPSRCHGRTSLRGSQVMA